MVKKCYTLHTKFPTRSYKHEVINTKLQTQSYYTMEEKKLNIKLSPEVAEGVYANLTIISHSPSEFVMDFIRMMPGMQEAQVKSRVVMTPDQAKKLLFALENNIKQYEKQFGTINLPGGPVPGSTIPMSFGGGEA